MRREKAQTALDRALDQWAERHALSPVRAEAIRLAALAAEEPQKALSYEWWLRLFDLTPRPPSLAARTSLGKGVTYVGTFDWRLVFPVGRNSPLYSSLV
ncbi:MAG TPA: hypothetical protein VFB21_18130 [Chthonomonadaceae bacterium]|nr:hypothetical protein [Chthonomonadaceae bacterium]